MRILIIKICAKIRLVMGNSNFPMNAGYFRPDRDNGPKNRPKSRLTWPKIDCKLMKSVVLTILFINLLIHIK